MKRLQPDLFAVGREGATLGRSEASPEARPLARVRHCKVCGLCDPLPEGVSWARADICSDCMPAASMAGGRSTTAPCPVKGCTGWRHPEGTLCESCKALLPEDLRLQLMRSATAERAAPWIRASIEKRYGPFDRPAIKAAAIAAAAKARAAVPRAT